MLKIKFDDDEPTGSVARRIVMAFNPGNLFKIRESYFRATGMTTYTSVPQSALNGKEYTTILPIDSIPKNTEETQSQTVKETIKEVHEQDVGSNMGSNGPELESYEQLNVEPQVDQTWRSKDKRRNTTFKITHIDDEHIHTDNGNLISRNRMNRYIPVSA